MADRNVAARAQIAGALVQIAVGLVQIAVGEDLNEVEDHCELALSVAEADRVARVRTVAAEAHNSEGLLGDSVTLISELTAFQSSHVFAADLLVDRHALHCGAVACALGDRCSALIARADQFFRVFQSSQLGQRYQGPKVAQEHLQVWAREPPDWTHPGLPARRHVED